MAVFSLILSLVCTLLDYFNRFTYLYYITDISASFFPAAREKFAKYTSKMSFKTLNISQDPLAQGFANELFDLIIAVQVVHATAGNNL